MTTTLRLPKRLLVGNPMTTTQMQETLLPKRLALPVYCSDPISSNAYATQEILLVLALGGASAVLFTPWVAVAVVSLLALVTLSYRQTCHAYPMVAAPTRSAGPIWAPTRPWWPPRP